MGEDEGVTTIRVAFAVFGLFWGTWAVAALDIQRFLELDASGLGWLVAATVVGTTVTNVVGGALAERHGAQRALTIGCGLWSPLLLAVALIPERWAWMAAFLLVVAAGGLLDVVLNVASAGLLVDRPGALLRAHASYNTGALLGAGLTGALLAAGSSWRVSLGVVAVAAGVVGQRLGTRPGLVPSVPSGEHVTLRDAVAELRRSRLLPLAAVFALGAAVEGGIGTFGVLYLRERLDIAVLAGAGAYVFGQALATVTRHVLGGDDARLGGTRAARGGLLLAGAGLVLEAATDLPAVAAIGLAVASIGAATYWPLLSAVANRASDRPGLAVGGVSAAGYLGFLAGPPLVGMVAEGVDLRAGVLALAVLAFAGVAVRLRSVRAAALAPASA